MNEEYFDPPAIIHHHVDRAALSVKVANCAATVRRTDRVNVEARMELGRGLTALRPLFKDGEWGDFLNQIKVAKQKASELMGAAVLSDEQVDSCETWTEVLDIAKADREGRNRPDPDDKDTEGGNSEEQADNRPVDMDEETAGQEAQGEREPLHCPVCERRGPRKGCEECARLQRRPQRPKRRRRQKDGAKPRGGEEAVNWRQPYKYVGALIVWIDRVGNVLKRKDEPEFDTARQNAVDAVEKIKQIWERDTGKKAPEITP